MRQKHLPYALLITLLWLSGAEAAAYRWVDENGVTHFSGSPPAGVEATRIAPPPPPAQSPEVARKRIEAQQQKLNARAKDRQLVREEREKAEAEAQKRRGNCETARHNLTVLEQNTSTRRRFKMADGSWVRLNPEQHQQYVDEANRQIKEFCQ